MRAGSKKTDTFPPIEYILDMVVPDGSGHVFVFRDVVGEPPGSVVDVFRESGNYVVHVTPGGAHPPAVLVFPPS